MKLMLAAHPEVDVWPLPDLLLLLVLEAGGSEDSPGCGLEPLSLRFLTYALPKVSRDGPCKGHYSRRGPWKSRGPSGEFLAKTGVGTEPELSVSTQSFKRISLRFCFCYL